MKLLAIDTSANLCSACVFDAGAGLVLSEVCQDIGRGHAEVLMGIIEDVLSKASTNYKDLGRIAVTIGPGSFTGVRVGMSVARGLGLSLEIPVVGISTLDACEAKAKEISDAEKIVTLLDAKRGELYCKLPDGQAIAAPYDEISELISGSKPSLCGAGAALLNEKTDNALPVIHEDAAPEIGIVARLASQMPAPSLSPEPLYLRSADAKVQAGFALERA